MMKKYIIILNLLACLALGGCTIIEPPECLSGTSKCESENLLGGGINYICNESGQWVSLQSCMECEGNTCMNENSSNIHCDTEGEAACLELETMSIQFDCIQHHLVPTICKDKQKCKDGRCRELSHDCTEGEGSCVWLNEMGVAIVSVCKDKQLLSMYCGKGIGCKGNVCDTEPVTCSGTGVILDELKNECICDTANHWTGTAGSCVCEANYLNMDGVCKEAVNCTNPGEVRDDLTNTCICDTAHHWTGDAGQCECADDSVSVDDRCEKTVSCSGRGVVHYESTDKCICDETQGWGESSGVCVCIEDKYFERNGTNGAVCCPIKEFNYDYPSCLAMDQLKKGDKCIFGRYRQLADSVEKYPIIWKILEIDNNKGIFLGSIYILENKKFNETFKEVTWETSTLRSWLNGFGAESNLDNIDYSEDGFMSLAFNEEERGYIQSVTNFNEGSGSISGGNSTLDKVFILGHNDSRSYLGTWALCTAYACAAGVQKDPDTCRGNTSNIEYVVTWWIRKPCKDTQKCYEGWTPRSKVAYGNVNESGYGVRPVLWIKK